MGNTCVLVPLKLGNGDAAVVLQTSDWRSHLKRGFCKELSRRRSLQCSFGICDRARRGAAGRSGEGAGAAAAVRRRCGGGGCGSRAAWPDPAAPPPSSLTSAERPPASENTLEPHMRPKCPHLLTPFKQMTPSLKVSFSSNGAPAERGKRHLHFKISRGLWKFT